MASLLKEPIIEHDFQTALHRLRDNFVRSMPCRLVLLETHIEELADGGPKAIESLRIMINQLIEVADIHHLPAISLLVHELKQVFEASCPQGNQNAHDLDLFPLHQVLKKLRVQVDKLSTEWTLFSPIGQGRKLWLVAKKNRQLVALIVPALVQAGFVVDLLDEDKAVKEACLGQERPAAVLMDMACLQNGHLTEATALELKSLCLQGLPLVSLLESADMAAKLAAYRFGAASCLAYPLEADEILDKLADVASPFPDPPYRILLVDDNQRQLAARAALLEQAGWKVEALDEPFQTAAILSRSPVDLLMLSMNMEACSGTELAAILREDEMCRQLPIVYLLEEWGIGWTLPVSDYGRDHFFAKTVKPQTLLTKLANYAWHFRQTTKRAEDHRLMLYECRRQYQAVNYHAIVSITDKEGRIVYVNEKFCEVSGYSRSELLGQNHRILKSDEHSQGFFTGIWLTISRGKIWQGEICNRRKNGSLYWVKSSIVPFLDNQGIPYQYISIRTDITKIKEHEIRLNILSRAVEASSGSISIADATDPKLPLVYVNPAFERITGYSRQEALGHNARFLLANDTDQPELAEIRAALREGRAGEALLRNYRKDGGLFWNKMRVAPVHDSLGKLSHFIGLTEDVTRQKEAEASRQEVLERLQKIASRVPGVVFQLRLTTAGNFCLPYASDAIAGLFRLSAEEARENVAKLMPIFHPLDRRGILLSIKASARGLTTWEHEFRVRFADGSVRWLLANAAPEQEEEGSILWHGYVSDISYRKNTERAPKESAKHTQAILDNVVDGVITIDSRGGVSSFNPAAQRIFGYAPHEIVGNNVKMLMPEPYASEHDAYLKRYVESGVKRIIGIGREVTGRRKDGGVFPMDLAISEIQLDNATLFIGLVRDISSRKRHEAQLLAAKNEAERANLAKSKFLSSMSHELRTPMNAVLGFAQLMEMDVRLLNEHREGAGEILKAGRHLMQLIDEVLDLAKIEGGNIELSIEAVVLSEVIDACLALVKPMAEARGIQIMVSADCSSILLRADSLRLKQCLLNLLSNAIKYNRPGGKVELGCRLVSSGLIRIQVSDTGVGIPKERLGELFRPFNRLGAEGLNIQGTGIGLAITRQLVELMGGAIGVDSLKGVGSTFWLELPQERRSRTKSRIARIADNYTTILYIDENIGNFKHMVELLRHLPDIHLMTAHSTRVGLDLLSTMPFELVLVDINMPQMDGFAFLKQLRKSGLSNIPPVIALSAIAGILDHARAREAGFVGYLEKPIDARAFFALLDVYLKIDPE